MKYQDRSSIAAKDVTPADYEHYKAKGGYGRKPIMEFASSRAR